MTSDRLNAVMILNVNQDLTDCVDITAIIRKFVVQCDIRKDTSGVLTIDSSTNGVRSTFINN